MSRLLPFWLFTSALAVALIGSVAVQFRGGGAVASGEAAPAEAMPVIKVDPAVVGMRRPAPQPAPTPTPDPSGYVVKRVLDIPGPMRPGDWHWDEAGVPDGPIVVTADLKAQTLSVFRGGYEIGAAVILYGADDKPTPVGVFPITQKKVHHVSNLYDAKMPYMQRLTNDGVAIHASELGPNLATHGCIGVPLAFAKKLFGVTRLGDKVIVTNGEMLTTGSAITAI